MDSPPARVTRPRWQLLAAVGFILSTGLGATDDGGLVADEGPPPHASGDRFNDGDRGNPLDEDRCLPERRCEPEATSDATQEPLESSGASGPEPEPTAVAKSEPEPAESLPLESSGVSGPEPEPTGAAKPAPEPAESADAGPEPEHSESADPGPSSSPSASSDPDDEAESPSPAGRLWVSGPSSLPRQGPAWESLVADAYRDWGTAAVADQSSRHGTYVFAGALVAVATGDADLSQRVRNALASAPGTESGGRTLALGRNLVAYVLAADLVGYRDPAFIDWVDRVRHMDLQGRTLISTHEDRPNNWGTHAGASRIAAALYLDDMADLDRAARVFRGWLGDRDVYAGFRWGDLSWQCDRERPVGINPHGCTVDGHDVGGVLPDDQRRGGEFTWPPPAENYVWEALQGAVVQAELLHRAGYPAWTWSDRALVRAMSWLHAHGNPAVGDDTWIPWLVNRANGTAYPAPSPSRHGKHLGYTDWTHR